MSRHAGPARGGLRLFGVGAGLLLLFVILVAVFAGRDLLVAKATSESAADAARLAAQSAVDGDLAETQANLTDMITDLERAQAALDTTWVHIAGRFPYAGVDIRASRSAVDAARDLALAGGDLLGFLQADRPPLFSGRRLDPTALALLADALDSARTHTAAARTSLGGAPNANIGALKENLALLDDVSRQMHDGLAGATALTTRLQQTDTDPFRVLILFENEAEMRATGGLMGFFAVLEVDDGVFHLGRVGPIGDLRSSDASGGMTRVPAPSEYVTRYGGYLANTALWSNVNLSPHFPWVAQVAGDLYTAATGEHADLIVRLDLTGTGEILVAVLPDSLSGLPFDPAMLATDVVFASYLRFPRNQDQNAYLASLVGSVFSTILAAPDMDARRLTGALAEAVRERRLAVFSDDPQIERAFATAGADGSLQPGEPGQVDVVVQNFGSNKLDLFTDTKIDVTVQPTGCVALGTVSTTLTNAAPPGAALLPAGELGLVGRWWVNTYLPRSATVSQILVDGEAVAGSIQSERDRPVAAKIVEIAPGESVTVTIRWQEALSGPTYRLRMQPQPMVNPATLSVSGFDDQAFTRTATFDIPTTCAG